MTYERIRAFDHRGDEYKRAFQTFLAHTDQKRNMRQWLEALLVRLPARHTLIDAGAGNGELTNWLARSFRRTIAIEPNALFCRQLRQANPDAEVIDRTILEATPSAPGDLVLSSHTFYYVPRPQWLANLERLVSWMSGRGLTLLVLQHPDSDCMRMFRSLAGVGFDLSSLAEEFLARHGDRYAVSLDVGEAHVETPDFDSAYVIAEFMLNTFPSEVLPARTDLADYIRANFRTADGGYRFSCHQDFLQIRRREA